LVVDFRALVGVDAPGSGHLDLLLAALLAELREVALHQILLINIFFAREVILQGHLRVHEIAI